MRPLHAVALVAALAGLLLGCEGTVSDAVGGPGGAGGAGPSAGGGAGAGAGGPHPELSMPDASTAKADAGEALDAGATTDAGPRDAGPLDAGVTADAGPPDAGPVPPRRARLLMFARAGTLNAQSLSGAGRTTFESTFPFVDGAMISIPLSSDVVSSVSIDEATAQAQLAPVANLASTVLKENFLVVYCDHGTFPDMFGDWSVVTENFRKFAAVARAAGFKGLAFDNEAYGPSWGNWPDDVKDKARTLREYQDQARARGKQLMQAMVAVFPDIAVITLHGPYISEPRSAQHAVYYSGPYSELLGPLFAGFLEGAGPTSLVVDGGEIYGLTAKSEFEAAYAWQRLGMADDATDCAFIPPALRPVWRARVSVGWGITNVPFPNVPYPNRPEDPASLGLQVRNALGRADDYVWLFPDPSVFGFTPDARTAIADAKRQYLLAAP